MKPTLERLLDARPRSGAGFVVLIDPDKLPLSAMPRFVDRCHAAGIDAFFVGGSLLHTPDMERYVLHLKALTRLPVIGFPGSVVQVVGGLDAVLFLSLISGRNPEYLIGQHVQAAPLLKRLGVEPIATGYMLVESEALTTAQYMSGSLPLPRNKPDVAAATALAGEMLGMQLVFLDAGSGASSPVPESLIQAVKATCQIPVVVGGGMRSPEMVRRAAQAGADFVVVGNALENEGAPEDTLERLVMAARGYVRA